MKFLAFIVLYVVLTLSFPGQGRAHDIDNLSTVLNAVPGIKLNSPEERALRVDPTQPLHYDGGVVEGRKTNSCFANPTKFKGHTMQQAHKLFWHRRRTLINRFIILGANINAANEYAFMLKTPLAVPFMNYDPFALGTDPFFPEVAQQYLTTYPQIGYSGFLDGGATRYDHFWITQHVDIPAAPGLTGSTNPLTTATCGSLNTHDLIHTPECNSLPSETFVLKGGDSYKTPLGRGDLVWSYYDRIPADPVADACMEFMDGNMTIEQAIGYALAHAQAGTSHLLAIESRIKYSELVLSWLRNRF